MYSTVTLAAGVPAAVLFDLDDTLAESKSPVAPEMLSRLVALLEHVDVCVISGARFEQFATQILANLPTDGVRLDRLHLMPTCGTRYHRFTPDGWALLYAEDLTDDEKRQVIDVLTTGAAELGLAEAHTWGPVVEDRHSQITFSALGQQAPVAAKAAWDPDGAKKEALRAYAAPRLPHLEVRSGGSTSIDVTRAGIDKAHGVRKLADALALPLDRMLFVGDRLEPGGNDYPVAQLGVPSLHTTGPEHTAAIVDGVLAALDGVPLAV